MQQHSENTEEQNDQVIHQFIQGFMDPRRGESKLLKKTNLSCRKMIETRISKTPDINRLVFKCQDDPWIKKIIVSYILLQMYHHNTLWGVENSKPKPKKNKKIQHKKRYLE